MFRCEEVLRVLLCGFRSTGPKAVLAFLVFANATISPSLAAPPPAVQWTQTPATQESSCSFGITMDTAGNLYTVGESNGTVFGVPSSYGQHYVAKYTANGNLAWENQWVEGTGTVFGLAVDGAGDVFMADGGLDKKFSQSGTLLWQTDVQERAEGVAVDTAGNSYVCGMSGTGYPSVSKVNSLGKLLWTSQLPSTGVASAVAVDGQGNAAIAGNSDYNGATQTQLGYAAGFDAVGNLLWSKQYGSVGTYNDVTSVAADGYGGIYMTGDIGQSGALAFAKYDQLGNQQWARNITYDGRANSIASDSNGAEYVCTNYAIDKYDLSGNLVGQFPMPVEAFPLAYSAGAFGIARSDSSNSYVSYYSVPEPSTLVLLGIGAVSLFGLRLTTRKGWRMSLRADCRRQRG